MKQGISDTLFGLSSLHISADIKDYKAEEEYKASGHVERYDRSAQAVGIEGNNIIIPGLSIKSAEELKERIFENHKRFS